MKHKNKLTEFLLNFGFAVKTISKATPLFFPVSVLYATFAEIFRSFVGEVLFLKYLITYIEEGRSFKDYLLLLLIFVGVRFLWEASEYIGDYWSYFQRVKVKKNLGEIIYKQSKCLDMEYFENPEFYDKYKRATDVISKGIYTRFAYYSICIIARLITAGFLISYISTVDAKFLLIFLSALVVIAIKGLKSKNELNKDKAMTESNREKEYMQRTVFLKDYSKDMRTSDIYSVIFKRFKNAIEKNREIIKQYGIKSFILEFVSDFFGESFPMLATFGYSVFKFAFRKTMSVADFSVAVSSIKNLKNTAGVLFNLIPEIVDSTLYFGNLREFLAIEPKLKGGERIPEALETLEFRDVSFTYSGNENATLKHISFTLSKGETLMLVGENGAGKSTLVKLIMRFYEPQEGEILYNGVNIREYNTELLREQMGTVFQDSKIFALSVAENTLCREFAQTDTEKVNSSLESAGVLKKILSYKHGIDTLLTKEFDKDGIGLSGGEKQKLAAARLFASEYSLAILDEPSSALDAIAETELFNNLISETKGKSVIYISHRLSSAIISDRILMLQHGEIIEEGSHAELMASNGRYAEMFNLQASSYIETECEVTA